ncbi:MAG: histone deacetylase [Acidimicrobiia bacterium]|nr:histone deacetylase [Acidimicrobiia bacterium]
MIDVRVLLAVHDSFFAHDTGAWHPERPDRITAAVRGVEGSGAHVVRLEPPQIALEDLYPVHDVSYVREIRDFCAAGGGSLDADTFASEASWEAALRSAGAGLAAVEALRSDDADTAFLAVRPPGHHALTARAMGFCLFNNIAVAAEAIVAAGERVAIFDWDVHHGNGTQDHFYDRDDVLYVSAHEFPFYPGSGWLTEDGDGAGSGMNVNIPFPASTAGDAYDLAMDDLVMPLLKQFDPDWVLVSAGYDAHASDPLADLRLESPDYGRMAARIAGLAGPSRVVCFLEGGYDLGAIEASVVATVRGLGGEVPERGELTSPTRSFQMLELAAERVAESWTL